MLDMHRLLSLKIRSSNGNIYSRYSNLPFSIPDEYVLPTQQHIEEFQSSLCSVLAAQWDGRHDAHVRVACISPLLNASFQMLNLKNNCVHLSNDTLMQGGMDFVPALQGIVELPQDLEDIKADIHELSVYSSALTIIPMWVGIMTNLKVDRKSVV